MDFRLTDDDLELKQMAREFAEKRLYPYAEEYDEKETTPRELIDEAGELGYLGFTASEDYGGMGLSAVAFGGVLEEICAGCAGFGILVSVHNSLCCEIVDKFGCDDLKKKYLTKMVTGEYVGAYCLTEPDAGTDVASIRTSAEDKGDHYLINGTKAFVTSGGLAGVLIVFARTDASEDGHKGISCFVVEPGWNGINPGKPEKKCGMKASDTREINFTDVKVPKENIIGKPGEGFKMAVSILNAGRLGVAFQAIGIAQAALNEAVKYSKERKQFNQPIANFQAIQFKIADMATRIDAGRLLAYRAAEMKDRGEMCARECSMAKLFCSQTANYVVNEAVQIHGGYGYMKEYAVERYFRDARLTEIYEGTTEAQRMVISRDILKD